MSTDDPRTVVTPTTGGMGAQAAPGPGAQKQGDGIIAEIGPGERGPVIVKPKQGRPKQRSSEIDPQQVETIIEHAIAHIQNAHFMAVVIGNIAAEIIPSVTAMPPSARDQIAELFSIDMNRLEALLSRVQQYPETLRKSHIALTGTDDMGSDPQFAFHIG